MDRRSLLLFLGGMLLPLSIICQANHGTKFEQLGTTLPTPNNMRAPDGSPGPDYWQQRVDYDIDCELDVEQHRLFGEEVITYHNNSPHTLKYLWLQLDENQHSVDNDNQYYTESKITDVMSEGAMRGLDSWREKDKYGVNIEFVKTLDDSELTYMINQTMMRVDLPQPLETGESFKFKIKWDYFLVDRIDMGTIQTHDASTLARGGYEFFEDNKNYLYTITQWYPRLCAFTDAEGWQNDQFTGRGEFALQFGNYDVEITLPDDHLVGATGECRNYDETLTEKQLARWKEAQESDEPVEVVTLMEAKKNELRKVSKEKQTWKYHAEDVRDFAWTASKKFVWDAMSHETTDGRKVMCMSYYGKEAYPIYRKFSSKAVEHTLNVYSRYSIPYPYPVAISVEAASGMEYPMICFNPGRAEADGTYSEQMKVSAISVIIHEVGHNYYPMIINSDERQWAWFDEGLTSFVQYIAEQEWNPNYESWFGPARDITHYMSLPDEYVEPIMTNAETLRIIFRMPTASRLPH